MYSIYILLLIGATTLSFFKTIVAILFMWINYIFFSVGFSSIGKKRKKLKVPEINTTLTNPKTLTLSVIAITSLLFSSSVVNFYTGQTPITVLSNLLNDESVYYVYQNYFKENQLNSFSLSKLPFIIMMFSIKFILYYSFVYLLIIKRNVTIKEKIYLFTIIIAHIYVGIGRGTSFEFFELLILTLFVIYSNFKSISLRNIKITIIGFMLVCVGMYIFSSGISNRGVEFNFLTVHPDVNYDPSGWLSTTFPLLAEMLFKLYGYFGFGFFYTSTYIVDVWFVSIENVIAGIIPFGYQLFTGSNNYEIVAGIIDVGVRWTPDFVVMVNNLGYVMCLFIFFLLGLISKYFYILEEKKPLTELTNFMILLQMISFPVGMFLMTSSANKLIVIILLLYWFWRIFINRRIKIT